MRVHEWHALGWLVWAVATLGFFFVWEYIGLKYRSAANHIEPLTYYVRKTVGTPNNPLWWILGAILLWMIVHFLFLHDVTGAVAAVRSKLSG